MFLVVCVGFFIFEVKKPHGKWIERWVYFGKKVKVLKKRSQNQDEQDKQTRKKGCLIEYKNGVQINKKTKNWLVKLRATEILTKDHRSASFSTAIPARGYLRFLRTSNHKTSIHISHLIVIHSRSSFIGRQKLPHGHRGPFILHRGHGTRWRGRDGRRG